METTLKRSSRWGVAQGWGVRWTVRLLCVLRKTQSPSQQESRKGRTKVENPLLLLSVPLKNTGVEELCSLLVPHTNLPHVAHTGLGKWNVNCAFPSTMVMKDI